MRFTLGFFLIVFGITPFLWNCATTIPPTGGPKDSLPPILQNSKPRNNETSYNQQQVILEFDEIVVLKNAKEEISITPSPGKDVDFYAKKNQVTVRFKKPLETNSTYSISFRQSIQDITEGNPAEDLRLAFSTGSTIDSLKLYGSVSVYPAVTPGTKFTVAIYQADTFNIYKHTPVYFTKTDKNGRFTLYNLKPGRYVIYCFDDKNKNLKCDTQSERFGIYSDSISLPQQRDSIRLVAVKLDSRPFKLSNYRNISNYGLIRTNKAPVSYRLTETQSGKPIPSISTPGKPEITYYTPVPYPDSLQVNLNAIDSLGQNIDSTFYIKKTPQKPVKEKFKLSFTEASYTLPNQTLSANIQFSHPIKNLQSDSVLLLLDTIPYKKIPIHFTRYDTIFGRATIESKLMIPDSIQKKTITLTLPAHSFVSILNDTSTTLSSKVTLRTPANLATLVILNTPSPNQYLQLLTEKGEIITTQALAAKNTFQYLDPNAVQLRILTDTDNNKTWSWPNPNKNTPAESLLYYTNKEGKRGIPLRANWEVELDWTKPIIVEKLPNRTTKQRR